MDEITPAEVEAMTDDELGEYIAEQIRREVERLEEQDRRRAEWFGGMR